MINKLDGYQFEILICDFFKHIGFDIEHTSLSGDGGIDVIAHNDQPIFCGKYIIQCKNWANPVGQPALRDLYGVVNAENANKGILITTSSFTSQAITFADGKNLELIDGVNLNKLLAANGFSADSSSRYDMVHFDQMQGFNADSYRYYKEKVRNDPSNINSSLELLKELVQPIIDSNIPVIKAGLLNELIPYIEGMMNRFKRDLERGSRKKTSQEQVSWHSMVRLLAFCHLLSGNIIKSIEMLNDNLFFVTMIILVFM